MEFSFKQMFLCLYIIYACIITDQIAGESKDIHHKFRNEELHKIFGTEDVSQVPDYEIVYPNTVDEKAEHSKKVQKMLHHIHPMYIHFKAFGLDFHFNLTLNKDLLNHEHFIEHHTKDGVERLTGRAKTHSTGKVVNDDFSHVALDHTSGLHGIIAREDDMYIMAPLPKRFDGLNSELHSHGAHIIYKKLALPDSHPAATHSCGTMDDTKPQENVKRSFPQRNPATSSQPEKIMELMIAVDKEMIKFYEKSFLHSYLINYGNVVAGVFRDPSLEYPITVALTRIVLLDNDVLDNATSMSDIKSKFTNWVIQNNPADDADPLHVDNAALLIRTTSFGELGTKGLADLTVCATPSSNSVTRDFGLMSAMTLAHELGHNLGLGHDYGKCPDRINLMAAGNVYGPSSFEFSKCHIKQMADTFRSPRSFCYNDKPTAPVLTNSSFLLYGQVYNGDKQCEIAFGKGYTYERGKCQLMKCWEPDRKAIVGEIYPFAHGTPCKPHHWCIYGECVRDNSTIPPPTAQQIIDGGWLENSIYTKCNRDCGGGMQWRERKCTNPAPKNGGKFCEGIPRVDYKTCNMHPCPTTPPNFRDEQCLKVGGEYSVYVAGAACKLLCKLPKKKHPRFFDLEDGTYADEKVSFEPSIAYKTSYDMCIQAKRKSVGCDKVLNSGTVHDRCHLCGGDGSTCKPVVGVNMSPFPWGGGTYYEVASLPPNIISLEVKELAPTKNFITVRVGQSTKVAYHVPSWSKRVSFAGLECYYKMEARNYTDHLICEGKSNDVVKIVWRNYFGGKSAGIQWKYFAHGVRSNSSTYEYIVTNTWGYCNKPCAGGIQFKSIICRRTDDKTAVSLSYCKAASVVKPDNPPRSCNTQACPAHWHLHPWSKCSKSCASGQRRRHLVCRQLIADGKYKTLAESACPARDKPKVKLLESCRVIKCVAAWNVGDWGACTATCGNGTRARNVTCKRVNEDGKLTEARDLECLSSTSTPKPITIETCYTDIPCTTWVIKYGSCSKTCGNGSKQPYAACYILDQRLDDSSCSGSPKPDLSSISPKPCNIKACDSYIWVILRESRCSVSCGNGVKLVKVLCKRVRDNRTVSRSLCNSLTEPKSKPCYAGKCPEMYEWKVVPGACSATRGKGTKTDRVICTRQSTGASVPENHCTAQLKPTVGPAKECCITACPPTYSWNVTGGPCSVTCGIGVRQSIVQCKRDSDYAVVDDSKCLLIKPSPGSFSCNMGQCPLPYEWREVFGDCSAPCGKGSKTSNFKCFMVSSSTLMSDSYCSSLPKNSSRTVECTVQCNWAPVYGPCLANCGSGDKLISLICKNENQGEVDISHCVNKAVGSYAAQSCSVSACKEYAPELTSVPKFYSVGCYKDNANNRHLPNSVGNLRNQITNWHDLSNVVKGCAVKAAGYKYFSVQYYGECWASNEKKYFYSGESNNCYLGTGGSGVNYVYTFNAPVVAPSLTAVKPLGCFADGIRKPRPLPQLIDNYRYMLETQKLDSSTAAIMISKCAKVAKMRGYTTFGIQYYGECWSGPNARTTYNKDGRSNSCVHGLGRRAAYYVYTFA